MKYPRALTLVLAVALPVVGFFGIAASSAVEAPRGSPQSRTAQLRQLVDTAEGPAEEPPRFLRTADGYLRFIAAAPNTPLAVSTAAPRDQAGAFLDLWRDLFVNDSAAVQFDIIEIESTDSRSYHRYQQTYDGLDIFCAQMVVQVNAAGGIEGVLSDIMRDTKTLDLGNISLSSAIDATQARSKAIQLLDTDYQSIDFEATAPILMIYHPPNHRRNRTDLSGLADSGTSPRRDTRCRDGPCRCRNRRNGTSPVTYRPCPVSEDIRLV